MYDFCNMYTQCYHLFSIYHSPICSTTDGIGVGDQYVNIGDGVIADIFIDPLFVDPENGDFNLQEDSPCIDAGIADIDGDGEDDTQYVGSAPDMGVFEFGAIYGCTDPAASNYDPSANMEDGSCVFGPPEITVSYSTGWNMVGLPLEVEDPGYQTFFPNAQEGTLYSFGDTYQEQNDLNTGNGYLLRLLSDDPVTFTGTPINEMTVSLSAGWNLFSGISSSLSVEDIYTNDIVYHGTIYGLEANYYNPETDPISMVIGSR